MDKNRKGSNLSAIADYLEHTDEEYQTTQEIAKGVVGVISSGFKIADALVGVGFFTNVIDAITVGAKVLDIIPDKFNYINKSREDIALYKYAKYFMANYLIIWASIKYILKDDFVSITLKDKDLEPPQISQSEEYIEKIVSILVKENTEKTIQKVIESYKANTESIENDFPEYKNFLKNKKLETILDEVKKTKLKPSCFKNHYKSNFNSIPLLQKDEQNNNIQKPIEDIFINLSIIKEEKTQNPQQKQEKKEPIDIKNLIKLSKKSIIFGKAGIGKTTLLKYISYMWANEKLFNEFEYVIYIPLRKLREQNELYDIVRYLYITDKKTEFNIPNNNSNMLFLFDGYDELTQNKKELLKDEIQKYNINNYIITSRSYAFKKGEFSVNEYFETTGFSQENKKLYIKAFFKNNPNKANLLINYLDKNPHINSIATTPIILEMLCTLWQSQDLADNKTITQIYTQIVEKMLKDYAENRGDNNYKRSIRKKISSQLQKIAFFALTQQKIELDGDFIEDTLKNDEEIDFFENNTIKSGFFISEHKEKDLLDNNLEFIHLSFQEYFSALYVANLPKDEQIKIISKYKFHPHLQNFFSFLGGLIEDKNLLIKEIKNQPKDITKFYELLLTWDILRDIKEEEIENELLNEIIDETIDTLWFVAKNEINYELLLKISYSKIAKCDKIVDILIEIIKDENIDFFIRGNIARALENLGGSNDKFLYTLIEIIKDENIDSRVRRFVAKALGNFGGSNDKIVYTLIEIIKDENFDSRVRGNVAQALGNLERSDDKFVDILIEIIKDENFDSRVRRDVAEALGNLERNDDKFVDILIEIIKDENIDFLVRRDATKALGKLIDTDFTIFKKIDVKIEFYEEFKNIISLNTIFKAYNSCYLTIEDIFYKALKEAKALYLKNNKLCTIIDTKEICTKDLSSDELNELNKILK